MLFLPMPTYVYETIPTASGEAVERFEFRQSMTEDALSAHPDTGKPIKRVITGGLGYVGATRGAPSDGGGGC